MPRGWGCGGVSLSFWLLGRAQHQASSSKHCEVEDTPLCVDPPPLSSKTLINQYCPQGLNLGQRQGYSLSLILFLGSLRLHILNSNVYSKKKKKHFTPATEPRCSPFAGLPGGKKPGKPSLPRSLFSSCSILSAET